MVRARILTRAKNLNRSRWFYLRSRSKVIDIRDINLFSIVHRDIPPVFCIGTAEIIVFVMIRAVNNRAIHTKELPGAARVAIPRYRHRIAVCIIDRNVQCWSCWNVCAPICWSFVINCWEIVVCYRKSKPWFRGKKLCPIEKCGLNSP